MRHHATVTHHRYGNAMYNKLFTKILDSTIWLEPDSTRLVWITMLAVMDEDGFVALSSVGNVAARARVSQEDAERAIRALEGPDSVDPTQDHEGRRIERVPYGWMVLNATKYRDIIRRETAKEQTRVRVAKYRARNASVTQRNEKLTPSVAVTEALSETSNTRLAPTGARPAPVEVIPIKGGEFPVEASFVAELDRAYPAVDVPQTLKEIRAWMVANPDRQKTRRGIGKCINSWCAREQEKHGRKA